MESETANKMDIEADGSNRKGSMSRPYVSPNLLTYSTSMRNTGMEEA